ncbi:uncharacterized protein LOC122084017 [Macadamia integrifolia]|uniref:uncharacterized protein LOC122084017 n=1 Tax=Macadamia integrifolia TaxID=60698 RepID=UPI001C4F1A77|nr:uncharacterized protein LOC122084017 [Macadamia integrifolia]XP_042507931.1 uncharacterized protein LOC122084017 [Macadamia integrifolia]XP_042507932.1 uncharacterized protein LOC122084017 [Macadamia integrifolia]
MAPAQVLTDLDSEMILETTATANVTSDKDDLNSSAVQDEKGLKCTSNFEDTTFDMEILLDQDIDTVEESVDTEVDITECVNADDLRLAHAEDPNATEYSSSFDDTTSGTEYVSRLSDAEVESTFCGGSESVFDGFGSVFQTRKKKLTAHWRKYIRPLMWRCKWLELRIKEFQCQALKYDKELAEYDQRKQFDSGQLALEGCCMRSLPFSRQFDRKKAMKRRKRKRVEDTVDISSYMSRHSLFSYYENKRSNVDGVSLDDDCGNQVIAADRNANGNGEFGVDYEWPLLDFGEGDNPLEQILWKIEDVQSRAHKLKTQLDKVMNSNAGRLSSAENLNLLLPSEVPSSSARSPTVSLGKGCTTQTHVLYTPPPHVSKHEIGDLVMPESAVSSYGEANPLPDIIESTMGLLSAADIALDQPQIGDSCEDIADDVLIRNQSVQGELYSFEKLKSQPSEMPCHPVKEQEENRISPVSAPELNVAQKTIAAQEQSILKSCLASDFQVPKTKRKRGERKAGSGCWSKKSSGEPDH